jgi:hypothetical protein
MLGPAEGCRIEGEIRRIRVDDGHPRMSELTIVAVEVQLPLTEGNIRNCLKRAAGSKFKKLVSGAPRISKFPFLTALVLGKTDLEILAPLAANMLARVPERLPLVPLLATNSLRLSHRFG